MNWVVDLYFGLSWSTPGQIAALVHWVTAAGLGLLFVYGGVTAWRRYEDASDERGNEETQSSVRQEAVLTNEEQVVALLDANGGRMRQTRIVESTGWSKSKVSMLLSEMDTEGSISKLRVGRENIISRPGSEPEAAQSTLESRV